MIPLRTAIPKSAIKPTPAEILKGISPNHSKNAPPIAESGITVKIRGAYFIELKAKYNSINLIINAIGTAMSSLHLAVCKFSN